MSTDFPTSLDTLTNPSASDEVSVVSHSSQHANANDAIEALEAKVGADGSAVETSHDYKLSNVTGSDKAVSLTGAETIANKNIDADSNTVSNIEVDNFKSSALSGSDTTLITGTSGADTQPLVFNSDGDAVGGTVPVAYGGTGQTTKTSGFDALSPNTTKGDITAHDGSDNVRVPVGNDDQILAADSSEDAGVKWIDPSSVSSIAYSLEAGEDIAEGDYVFVSDGNEVSGTAINETQDVVLDIDSATEYYAQTFTLEARSGGVRRVYLRLLKQSGSPTGNLTVALRATSAGSPTGANLASDTVDVSTLSSAAWIPFDLDATGLTAGDTYAIVVDPSGLTVDGSNYIGLYRANSDEITGSHYTSADGSSWTLQSSNDITILIDMTLDAGKIYKYDQAINNVKRGGIALNTATSGNDVSVQTQGVYSTSGLTVGKQYLQSTAGTYGTTQSGDFIGSAISSTQLLLNQGRTGTLSDPYTGYGTGDVDSEPVNYSGILTVNTGTSFGSGDSLSVSLYRYEIDSIAENDPITSESLSGAADATPSLLTMMVQAGHILVVDDNGFTSGEVKITPID